MRPRQTAIQHGDRFYEGNPCKEGGHTLRYTRQSNCVECKINDDKYRYINDPKRKAYHQSPKVLARKRKTSKEWYHKPENKKHHKENI